ncbi:TPA: KxYKxGKxW signal peptide domain-containing protein, partial [Streptococcus suis]|nr:KxYKxGKxW signal peptide domain-containing protein [Streptococcus suis]
MEGKNKKQYTEVSRKSRVKMHKSGKHWVRTVMSQIGFIQLGKRSDHTGSEVKLASSKHPTSATRMMRGLIAAGAVVSGGVSVDQVFAENTVVASEVATTVLVNEETVSMSNAGTESDTNSQSTSESESDSLSISESESVSMSESVSESESLSSSESASSSESVSISESTSAAETLSNISSASETSSSESETASTTTTVAEAKGTLEQVTSEAEILVQIANSETGISQELENAIALSIKDIAVAKSLLGNESATVVEIQTVISSLQASSQTLGLLLLQDDEDGIITFALNTTTTATLKVGEGEGILVDTLSTASPAMDNANGATVTDQTVPTPFAATAETGWHTFGYYSTESYDDTQESGYDESDINNVKLIDGTAINAYLRYSLNSDPTTSTVLAELVDKATGNVVESYQIDPGSSATFTYPTTVNANNQAITILYDTATATDGSPGSIRFTTLNGTTYYYNNPVPAYSTNTTYYKTTDGTTIATYTLVTIGGQTVTASGVRDFVGYDYSSTTNAQATVEQAPGTVHLFSKIDSGMDALKVKSLATVVDSNGAVTKGLYIVDPAYTGTLDWSGTNTDGFIKILETSVLDARTDSGYSWNTSDIISADYTTDTYNGSEIMVFYTSPDGLYRLVGQFSGDDSTDGTYGRIYLGVQIWSTENTGSTEYKWLGSADSFVNNGHAPLGVQIFLRNTYTSTANETTHWYTVDTSESESLSESNSLSLSESESTSSLKSLSESESNSLSESVSNSESIAESVSESLSESVSNSESVSLSESIAESVSESVSESISESVSESVSESISESVSESISESVSESISESTSESLSESVSESISESVSESISESVSESISESVSESISESVSESISESVSESIS